MTTDGESARDPIGAGSIGDDAIGGRRGGDDLLIEAGLAMASDLSLDRVLQRIVDAAADVIGARYAALGVVGADGGIEEFVTHGVTAEQRTAIGPPPVGKGLLGALIDDARPIRIDDISADPRSSGFPDHHPPMRSFMGAPVTARGRVFGNIYLTEKIDGPVFTEDDERTLVILATQAGVAVENARLYGEARLRERWLDAVREIGERILAGDGTDEIIALIAERARELVGAREAAVTMAGDDAAGDDAAGDDAESGTTVRVPLAAEGVGFGTLTVAHPQDGRRFDPEQVRLVESFAGQAAVALAYARAQSDLRRLAVMEDRERIAKELHDGVIQSLFGVGMGVQGVASLATDERIVVRLEDSVREIDRVIRDLRNYIFGLRPGILADRQLDQALRAVAEGFAERSGVTTVVDIDERLAAELGSRAGDLVQIAREALSNVGRHAEATTCRVRLAREGGSAVLEIDDDGRGFDGEPSRPGGQGVSNLRARAEALGGATEISGVPGEGTTVRVEIPLTESAVTPRSAR